MPRPLSIVEIYRESLRVWVGHLGTLTILAVLLELPLLIAELVLHVSTGFNFRTDQAIAVSAVSVPVALYGLLSHHFLSGLLEKIVAAAREAHPTPTVAGVLRDLPWGRLVAADLIATAATIVGFLLFIVPGIIVTVWFTPLLVIVNLERDTVRRSIARSRRLVKGHFWRVLFVALFALIVVDLLAGLTGRAAASLSDSHTVEVLFEELPGTLLMPMLALPIVVLSLDLVALDAAEARA